MRLGWGKGHLQVCIRHPQRCGGGGEAGQAATRGRESAGACGSPQGTLASFSASSILSPLDHLLDNISIILKISLLPLRSS